MALKSNRSPEPSNKAVDQSHVIEKKPAEVKQAQPMNIAKVNNKDDRQHDVSMSPDRGVAGVPMSGNLVSNLQHIGIGDTQSQASNYNDMGKDNFSVDMQSIKSMQVLHSHVKQKNLMQQQ